MEKQYHIGLNQEMIKGAKFAILPGDPGRVPIIARQLDEHTEQIAFNREYCSYLAHIHIGVPGAGDSFTIPVLIMSTGIGCPSTAMGVEELAKIGVDTCIRVGTCGSLQKEVRLGDVVIVTASVREEGTSNQYISEIFPAVANPDVVNALRMAAQLKNIPAHVGIGHTKDSFYAELDDDTIPNNAINQLLWKSWIRGKVLATAMEASALYVVGTIRGLRCAEILVPIGLTYESDPINMTVCKELIAEGVKEMTNIVGVAIKILTKWDLGLIEMCISKNK